MFSALGLVYDLNNNLQNHRSLLKILLNPWLRTIGWHIATSYNKITRKMGLIVINRCPKKKLEFSFSYDMTNLKLIKKRRWI